MEDKLRKALELEGAFAAARKRALPRFPFRVALVSSKRSDAANDFLTRLRERAPHIAVRLVDTPVQGAAAGDAIANAIRRADRLPADAIVVTRGGGSYEDLYGFNTAAVARAILATRLPVVTAIGHEGDWTIADAVADVRAMTPTDATIKLAPATNAQVRALLQRDTDALRRALDRLVTRAAHLLDGLRSRSVLARPAQVLGAAHQRLDEATDALTSRTTALIRAHGERLAAANRRLDAQSPSARLARMQTRLGVAVAKLDADRRIPAMRARIAPLGQRLDAAMQARLERSRSRLAVASAHLRGSNPEAILERGYAIVEFEGRALRDASAVPPGAKVRAKLARGRLALRVEGSEPDGD